MISPYVVPGLSRRHMIKVNADPHEKDDLQIAARIMQLVSISCGVSYSDMTSKNREKAVVFARHVAIYLINQRTRYTATKIGALFGLDHTSVSTTRKKMQGLIKVYQDVRLKIEQINEKI